MGDRLDVVVMVERIGGGSYTLLFHALKDGSEVVRGRFVTGLDLPRHLQEYPAAARHPGGAGGLQGALRRGRAGLSGRQLAGAVGFHSTVVASFS